MPHTNPSILWQLGRLSTPLILSNLLGAASSFIAMYFIAQLDENALAAGALITSSYSLLMMVALSILYSVGILVGQHHGAEKKQEIGRIVYSGMLLALIIGLMVIIALLNITKIFLYFDQPLLASQLAGDYFRGLALGFIPALWMSVYTQLFMGLSKSKVIFFLSLFTVISNVLLSYLFIFKHGFWGGYGVYGAGLANSITACLALMLQLLYIKTSPDFKPYQLFQRRSLKASYLKLLYQIGLPISMQYGLELFAFAFVTYLIGTIGTNALAAQQISLQLSLLAIMIVMGFSQAASILSSQAYGQQHLENLQSIRNKALTMGFIAMSIMALFFISNAKWLISFYIDVHLPENESTVSLAVKILSLAALTQIFDAGRNISAGILRGVGDSKSSMKSSFLSCWLIGLPLGSMLAFVNDYGAPGIRFGMMIGIMVGCYQLITHSRMFMHHRLVMS